MKLYATIDSGTVVSSIESSFLPNEHWKEFEVDHVDQLVIKDNDIVVDKTQPNRIETYKQLSRNRSRLIELKDIISNHIADRELYNIGITTSMSLTEEEYKNVLLEFNTLRNNLV